MAREAYHETPDAAARATLTPFAPLDAFLTEHRLCRPGLDHPDVSPMLVALWCRCGARVAVRLPPVLGARVSPREEGT
jgi:hypothetical protein